MPTVAEALALAVQQHQDGWLQEAEQIYQQILAVDSDHADALHLLGVIAYQLGKHALAVERISRAIELNGTKSAFHSNLGSAFKAQRELDKAVACYRRALELKPDYADAHYNLGNTLQAQGKLDEAIAFLSRALELKPDYAEAHNNLGTAFKDHGKLDEAVACFRRALELRPNYAEAHSNLGNATQAQGKLDESFDSYLRALELKPDYAEAHNNLGTAFKDHRKLDEAVACFRRALELKPDFAEAHNNLGTAIKDQLKLDEAVACYRRALDLKPDYATAHFSLASVMLQRGDFEHGWPEYEWRWKTTQLVDRKFFQPRWDGGPLQARTILLHAEQGYGDTLQFIRYAALVKKQNPAATVIVECQRPLEKLLATCPGFDRLIPEGDEIPRFDVHSPLLSLPGILKTSVATIPAAVPYLFADPSLVAHWRESLRNVNGLRVGINWKGRPGHGDFRKRDITLNCFAALAQIPGVRLISLQRRTADERRTDAAHYPWLYDPGHDVDTTHGAFMDTAAVMTNLDLVMTSDTSVPHLAGALGVPVWLALPYVPDWRWLLDRIDSPWYPTMRLFRQKSPGDWNGVFDEIHSELQRRIAIAS